MRRGPPRESVNTGADGSGRAPSRSLWRARAETARAGRVTDLRDFAVFPQEFTPNQDGINDRIRVNYVLTKPADVRVWIEDDQGRYVTSILEEEKNPVEPGMPGRHQYDYDAGVDADAPPPPDGPYTVVGEARDGVGNVVRETAPLTIVEGGVPRATILNAEIGPSIVPLGEALVITSTVKNIGSVPIRTTGPPPNTEYTTQENYNTKGFPQESGAFRLGAEFDANVTGLGYPYRWRLGDDEDLEVRVINGQEYTYLPMGKTVTVTYRGELVAEIRPLPEEGETFEQRLRRLAEDGILVRAAERHGGLRRVARRPGALERFLEDRD